MFKAVVVSDDQPIIVNSLADNMEYYGCQLLSHGNYMWHVTNGDIVLCELDDDEICNIFGILREPYEYTPHVNKIGDLKNGVFVAKNGKAFSVQIENTKIYADEDELELDSQQLKIKGDGLEFEVKVAETETDINLKAKSLLPKVGKEINEHYKGDTSGSVTKEVDLGGLKITLQTSTSGQSIKIESSALSVTTDNNGNIVIDKFAKIDIGSGADQPVIFGQKWLTWATETINKIVALYDAHVHASLGDPPKTLMSPTVLPPTSSLLSTKVKLK